MVVLFAPVGSRPNPDLNSDPNPNSDLYPLELDPRYLWKFL